MSSKLLSKAVLVFSRYSDKNQLSGRYYTPISPPQRRCVHRQKKEGGCKSTVQSQRRPSRGDLNHRCVFRHPANNYSPVRRDYDSHDLPEYSVEQSHADAECRVDLVCHHTRRRARCAEADFAPSRRQTKSSTGERTPRLQQSMAWRREGSPSSTSSATRNAKSEFAPAVVGAEECRHIVTIVRMTVWWSRLNRTRYAGIGRRNQKGKWDWTPIVQWRVADGAGILLPFRVLRG